MRVSELLGCRSSTRVAATSARSWASDASRTARSGESNATLRVDALVVHRRALGAFLGYQLREQSGPHPVGALMRWVHRDARLVPWSSVTEVRPDVITADLTRR